MNTSKPQQTFSYILYIYTLHINGIKACARPPAKSQLFISLNQKPIIYSYKRCTNSEQSWYFDIFASIPMHSIRGSKWPETRPNFTSHTRNPTEFDGLRSGWTNFKDWKSPKTLQNHSKLQKHSKKNLK